MDLVGYTRRSDGLASRPLVRDLHGAPYRSLRGGRHETEADCSLEGPPAVSPPHGHLDTVASIGVKRDAPTAAENAPKKKPRKRANYLKHAERCSIINRVSRGESQAALAREFSVTRAAVCQMYKNREEILAREGSDTNAEPHALDLQSRNKTVALLATSLRDRCTRLSAFRRAAARLTFILVEEALATADAEAAELFEAGRRSYEALPEENVFCGISLGAESAPFEDALRHVDPDAPTGRIEVKEEGRASWRLLYLDVPANISKLKVLLFSTSGNGGAECKAIES